MVDVEKTEQLLKDYFRIPGTYEIDSHTGIINVDGNARLKHYSREIPMQFGHISNDFKCYGNHLTSLKGSPQEVGGNFDCSDNLLTDLTHAPSVVGSNFLCQNNKLKSLRGAPSSITGNFICWNNPFTTLDGAPEHVGGTFLISYAPHLPLLRLLMYDKHTVSGVPVPVYLIMEKYSGQGRAGALKAAAELIRAGYQENARW